MNEHKFNRARFDERVNAKKQLELPHTPPNAVPALVDRVDEIEKLIGVVAVII